MLEYKNGKDLTPKPKKSQPSVETLREATRTQRDKCPRMIRSSVVGTWKVPQHSLGKWDRGIGFFKGVLL
jgi:hypothetical protein